MTSHGTLPDFGTGNVPASPSPYPSVARRPARSRRVPVALLSCLLAGCATSGFDLSESDVRRLEARSEEALVAAPSAPNAQPRLYRIQAGDLLALRFFFNPEFDQSVRVQPDGAITIPFLGTRSVHDMSIPEVTEMVRAVYAQELRQPQVVVQLVEAVERRVYVGGAVRTPKEVPFRPGLTPLEVVLSAGGFSSSAKANEVILIRKDRDGRPVPAVVDLADVILQADASAHLQPWDVVFVPRDRISKTNEWVDKYLRQLLLINGISFGYQLNPNDTD